MKKGIVLDPFMGAGSTIAAAANLGLKSVGVEVDSRYFAMAKSAIPKLARFQKDRNGSKSPQRNSNIEITELEE